MSLCLISHGQWLSDWDFRISDLVKTPIGTDIYLLWWISMWSPEGPVSKIHSTRLHVGAPGNISDLLRSAQMLKRKWGAESNGKIPHLFIPSKIVTLVPEFAFKTCLWTELQSWFLHFQWKPALGQNTLMMIFYLSSLKIAWLFTVHASVN